MYSGLVNQSKMEFDYEVSGVLLDEEDHDKLYFRQSYSSIRIPVDYSKLNDKKEEIPDHKKNKNSNVKINYAWCLKRLVSKKKRRFENEDFDLDLSYITKRVIAMGFPSSGMETLYRNNIKDVTTFFERMHHNQVKVYNLCLEKERIYPKSIFTGGVSVGLFPSKDHNPCPIKLILDFCVDICLYLLRNENAVAAVHCKAGKGRTGVMICCYLIFTGICDNAENAMKYYALVRTYNGRGVTIPSQIKYIQYFESFLISNYAQPYINMIPKIIKYNININTKNIIHNFINDPSYFIYPNKFNLNFIKIGPFNSSKNLTVQIYDYDGNEMRFPNKKELLDKIEIISDIKVTVKGSGVAFYFWVNLWYCTLDLIKTHIDEVSLNNNNYYFKEEMDVRNKLTSEDNQEEDPEVKEEASQDLENKGTDNKEKVIGTDKKGIKIYYIYPYLVTIDNQNNNNMINMNNNIQEYNKIDNPDEIDKEGGLDSAKELIKNPEERESTKEFIPKPQFTGKVSLKTNQPNQPNQIEMMGRKGSILKVQSIKKKSILKEEAKVEIEQYPPQERELDKLSDIIDKLNHDKDLNMVVNAINPVLLKENKRTFKNNVLNIYLLINELDKFHQAKKMLDRFYVRINYSLNV